MLTNNHRLHALDNCRALLVLLGIPFHVAFLLFLTYASSDSKLDANHFLLLPTPPSYHYLFLSVFYIHTFFMPGFFLLAGFSAHLLYQRVKVWRFLRNRSVRIGVPFLFFMACLIPGYLLTVSAESLHTGLPLWPALLIHYQDGSLMSYFNDTRDKWFLYYLLWFYVFTLVSLMFTLSRRIHHYVEPMLLGPWAYVLLPVLSALLLLQGNYWFPVLDVKINLSVTLLFFYYIWYVLGWWLWPRKEKIQQLSHHAALKFSASIILYICYLVLYAHYIDHHNRLLQWLTLFAYTSSMTFGVFALIGVVWRYWDRDSRIFDYISQASYWIYLIKIPLLAFILPGIMYITTVFYWQFALTIIICLALCLLSYQIFVRYTFIGKILGSYKK